jgi:hypothetical protein
MMVKPRLYLGHGWRLHVYGDDGNLIGLGIDWFTDRSDAEFAAHIDGGRDGR